MEREVGGGIGMGKTCKPKAFSFQYMTKFTTNKKKKRESKVSLRSEHIIQKTPGHCPKDNLAWLSFPRAGEATRRQ